MTFASRTLLAAAVAASLIGSAHAAPLARTLDITWYKDGKLIDSGRHIVADSSGVSTYLHRSGQEIGYAACTSTPQGPKLTPQSVFVGRSLLIRPVSIDLDDIGLSVSVIDTVSGGKHKANIDGCTSEVVDVQGYTATEIPVHLRGTQTVEVPMKDPHYRLVLSLHPETL